MLKKIIILIVLIILGGVSYEYIPNLFSNNDQIIYIDGDKDQYKFSPTDKEGKNFNGESLKIYEITRERLLPNDDDKNEVFEPIINAAQSYTMKIYDRWGGIIYQGENQGWDGQNAPSGQYFYSIEIIDYKNKKEKEVGQVTLIK